MIKSTLLFSLGLLLLTGCGSSSTTTSSSSTDDTSSGLEATLSSIQENIFTPTCAVSGCHSSASASEQLSLADGEAFDNLVNVDAAQVSSLKRVDPSDPDNSYVIHKLEGTHTSAGGSGAQMPKDANALSDEQINAIREWIENGADDN